MESCYLVSYFSLLILYMGLTFNLYFCIVIDWTNAKSGLESIALLILDLYYIATL